MTDSNIENRETDRQRSRMGKTRIKMKVVVYALSPFQQKIMPGLWKDLPGKIHHKVSENWISATLLLAPLVGVYTFQHLYVLGEKTATPKPRPKASGAAATTVVHSVTPSFAKPTPRPSSTVKSKSVDDSYSAFLEDMKTLGALDG